MPADLVQKINQEVRKGMKTPTVQKQLAQESMETQDWDAARFTSYVAAEVDKWSAATSVIKVKP
jgi:tripartite-type tricarboxylate transporter receptor subunit TctC